MAKSDEHALLAAETNHARAQELWRALLPLGQRVCLAASAQEAVELLRRELFGRAVVAVELETGGELLLARFKRLSGIERIVAIGPPGDARMEVEARLGGADMYVVRPVSTSLLSRSLGLSPTLELKRPAMQPAAAPRHGRPGPDRRAHE